MRAMSSFRAVRPVAALSLALALIATPARAQFGILKRAAEKRVEQKAEDRVGAATLIEPTFDNTTLEITAERLDKYQAAMEARKAQQAQNRAAYEALDRRATATRDSARMVDNQRDREAYESASRRYDDSRSGIRQGLEAEQEKRGQALAAKAQANPLAAQNDPDIKRFMAIVQEVAAAQQRNDPVALKTATDKYATYMGGATDSASLDRATAAKYGPRPARPASMVRSDMLNTRADSLGTAARALIGASTGVRGAAVGMTDVQARMFWERIASWLSGMRDAAPITKTFSKAEYELLVARRGALRKAWYGSE
jgi:hypothetical protein